MRPTAILLSLFLPITLGQVIQGGWTAFGDSYAAGIGAGNKHASDTGDCRRRANAYPNQVQTDGSLAGGMNVEFSFQACSSAKIAEVQSQIATFRDGPEQLRGFATISVGGNDAGFSEVIEACLVRAKFGSPSCDSVIEAKTAAVKSDDMRQNLEDAYRAILDAAKAPGKMITSFRLVVTGYARFFNEETTDCNNKHISFWGLLEPNKQYLTVGRRQALNKLVTDMNEVVKAAAETVSKESEFGQVVFVPIDDLFEGHRFCEPGATEPDNKNPNTWFFLLQGRD
ncbi:SGNH hydrolase, partial [Parathielavia hyrcaniae]